MNTYDYIMNQPTDQSENHNPKAAPLNEFSEWLGKHMSSKVVLMSLAMMVTVMGLMAALLASTTNQDIRQSANYTPQACSGQFVVSNASEQESITAYGRYWNFDEKGNPWPRDQATNTGNGDYLESIPRYATGPCAGQAAGTCTFDTRTFLTSGGQRVESITASGKYWNFNRDGSPWAGNGSKLETVPRYANGPCSVRPVGTACTFDTRAIMTVNGQTTEAITAYGRYWNFDDRGNPWPRDQATNKGNGDYLESIPRYATGPCAGQAAGTCTFDSRTMMIIGGKKVESITAYGKGYNYMEDGTPWEDNGFDLTAVGRYASGPCASQPTTSCKLDTRSGFN